VYLLAVLQKVPFIEGYQKYRKVINFSVFGRVLKKNYSVDIFKITFKNYPNKKKVSAHLF